MKKYILIILFIIILIPTILSLDQCQDKEICFDKEQQDCLFLNLLPYTALISIFYVGIYFINRTKIKNYSLREKTLLIISSFLIFVLITFLLGKLYIFNKCLLQ
jgi:hypothetical protein